MLNRRLIHLTLSFVVTIGLGVSGATVYGQSAPSKKAASGKSTSAATGKRKAGSKKVSRKSRRQPGQKAPTTDRISEIQSALAKNGAYSGEPNGKWDEETVGAMKKFQAASGLNPSGKLDALTLQKLGLGSQTAGVAAPMPPVSSSAVSSSTSSQTANRQ